MSNQYVMAHIQIPIKIHENGATEPLPEYIKISISECNELPEKVETPAIEKDFMEQIHNIVSPTKKEDTISDIVNMLTISKEEVKNKKQKHHSYNTTFKNNVSSHRRTKKSYFTSK